MLSFLNVSLLCAALLSHSLLVGAGALYFIVGDRRSASAVGFSFFAISLGLALNMLVLFVLGMLGWFTRGAVLVAAALLCLLALAACRHAWRNGRRLPSWGRPTLATCIEAAALAVLFLVCIMVAFHPPGMWDDTLYQLPLARLYVQEQGIVLSEYIRYSLFPQNFNLLMSLGLMFGGVVHAQALVSLPLFVIALGLVAFSHRLTGSGGLGLFAALSLFWLEPVRETLGFAYVDNGLAMFCWAACYACVLTQEEGGLFARRWALLAGLLAGAAAGTKLFGVVMVLVLALVLLWHLRRQARGERAAVLGAYAVGVLVAGAGWYIRSAWISGDPVHPAGAPVFGYFLWNEVDYAWQSAQAANRLTTNPLRLWQVLVHNGVAFWAFAFAGLLLWRSMPRTVRYLYGIFLVYFVFWFFATQVDRYLSPVVVIGALLSVFAVYAVLRSCVMRSRLPGWLTRAFSPVAAAIACVLALQLLTAETANSREQMRHWNEIMASKPAHDLFAKANTLIPEYGPKLLQIGFEAGAYYFEGTMIGDWFGPGRYWDLMHCTEACGTMLDSAEMVQHMQRHGARMLLFGHHMDKGFDPDRYSDHFQVVMQTSQGILMVLKSDHLMQGLARE